MGRPCWSYGCGNASAPTGNAAYAEVPISQVGMGHGRFRVPGAGSDALPLPRVADFPARTDAQEQHVREAVLAKLAADPEGCLARYRERFGNILNADNAVTLFEEYNQDPARYRVAVHPVAVWIRDELFRRALRERVAPGRNRVAFTAGANAAGKTTAISFSRAAETSQVVLDSTFSNAWHAGRLVDQTLAADKRLTILYVRRPLREALDGMLERAETEGRLVSIQQLLDSDRGAAETVRGLWRQYGKDPRFQFRFIDNSGGSVHIAGIDLTAAPDYTEIRKALYEDLERYYRDGQIDQKTYRRVRGSGDQSEPPGGR